MIQKKAKKAQLSVTDFLVATSLRTEIHVAENIKPLLIELKRIGNNINQITMKINAGAFHSADFMEVIQGQRMLYQQLPRIGEVDDGNHKIYPGEPPINLCHERRDFLLLAGEKGCG